MDVARVILAALVPLILFGESAVAKLVKKCKAGGARECQQLTDLVRQGDSAATIYGVSLITDTALLTKIAIENKYSARAAAQRLLDLGANQVVLTRIARESTDGGAKSIALSGVKDVPALLEIAGSAQYLDQWEEAVAPLVEDGVSLPPDMAGALAPLRERLAAYAREKDFGGFDHPRYPADQVAWDEKIVQALADHVSKSSWPILFVSRNVTGHTLPHILTASKVKGATAPVDGFTVDSLREVGPSRVPPGKLSFCAGYWSKEGDTVNRSQDCMTVSATLAAGHCYAIVPRTGAGTLVNTVRIEITENPSIAGECRR